MKRIFRFTYIALVAALATMVSSCTNEYEYDPATTSGEQVYFDQDQATTIEIDKTKSSFTIPLYRVNTEGTLTVPLQFTPDEGNIYTVPTEVTFQNGESSTMITITYDPDKAEYGTYVGGTLAIADAKYTTPYGFSQLVFTAGATEWVDMQVNGNPATATYREDLVTHFFGVDNLVYQVPIQESKVRKGMYRLVNPYGALYEYNADGDYDTSMDYYLTVNATDPDYVYVEESPTGMDWSYGSFSFSSLVAYWLSGGNTLEQIKAARPDAFGKLENGVITMPAGTMLISMSKYNDGGWYTANDNGLFAIALPGHALADYTTTFELIGRLTDTNEQDYAQGTVTLGPDVASAKVAIVAGDADVEATAEGIIDGSVESQEIVSSGDVNLPFTDSGDYTVVIVVYGSDGKPVKTFSYPVTLVSSKENVEQFEDIAAGVMTNGASDFSPLVSSDGSAWGYLGEGFPANSEAVLSRSKSDPTHYRLTPWLPFDGAKPLDFHWDEATGVLTVDNCPTGLQTQDGYIYATDAMTYNSNYFGGKSVDSKYDAATGTLHFFLIYTGANYEGFYACEEEAFTISDEDGAKGLKRVVAKAGRTSTNGTTMRNGLRKHFVKVMKPLGENSVH